MAALFLSHSTRGSFSCLCHMQIPLEDPGKRLLELLIGECVTKGIHGTIGVAQEVREHEPVLVRTLAEALHERKDVVRCPAEHEAAENKRDRSEGLAGTIFRF